MPGLSRALAALLALSVPLAAAAEAFPDIGKSPFKAQIEELRSEGILSGYPDGTFRPEQPVNRAEFLKVALGGSPVVENAKRRCFPDVNPRAWYGPIVCEAKQRRIVSGDSAGRFRPDAPVNMAEALRILLRAQRVAFPDKPSDPWYEPYVEYAHSHGIVSKHSYLPWETVTRGRMAQLLSGVRKAKDAPPGTVEGFPSSGCGKAAPATPPVTVDVSGVQRRFLIDVPRDYDSRTPARLIFAFHGRTNSNAQVRGYLELTKTASAYFVVYPESLKNGSSNVWTTTEDGDYAFFDALLAELSSRYCIDTDQVYVVGHSLGAWFANSLACARGNVIRAAATLGGSTTRAECTGPVAAMVMHNPKDNLAAFSGGEQARDQYLAQNHCSADAPQPAEPSEYKCVRYSCPDAAPVLWCPLEKDTGWNGEYYPHVWPGGAAGYVMRFFGSVR